MLTRSTITAVMLTLLVALPGAAQSVIAATELADYRLTAPVFARFTRASREIMRITGTDPRYALAPLFTQEIIVSGDAASMATGLLARLENDPALVSALETTALRPREYATFALALFAARLAHGFVEAGVIQVRAGIPADNVRFVAEHRTEVSAVLLDLGISD